MIVKIGNIEPPFSIYSDTAGGVKSAWARTTLPNRRQWSPLKRKLLDPVIPELCHIELFFGNRKVHGAIELSQPTPLPSKLVEVGSLAVENNDPVVSRIAHKNALSIKGDPHRPTQLRGSCGGAFPFLRELVHRTYSLKGTDKVDPALPGKRKELIAQKEEKNKESHA